MLTTELVYCGDNLDQLPKLPDACVDLIYIDPPFNSDRNGLVQGTVDGRGNGERVGYPTQKAIELLERIIAISSKPDDVVLDAFCGGGTALVAAHNAGRITTLSVTRDRHHVRVQSSLWTRAAN